MQSIATDSDQRITTNYRDEHVDFGQLIATNVSRPTCELWPTKRDQHVVFGQLGATNMWTLANLARSMFGLWPIYHLSRPIISRGGLTQASPIPRFIRRFCHHVYAWHLPRWTFLSSSRPHFPRDYFITMWTAYRMAAWHGLRILFRFMRRHRKCVTYLGFAGTYSVQLFRPHERFRLRICALWDTTATVSHIWHFAGT